MSVFTMKQRGLGREDSDGGSLFKGKTPMKFTSFSCLAARISSSVYIYYVTFLGDLQ